MLYVCIQIYQAGSLKASTEWFRRMSFRLVDEEAGEGYCAGALYWQMNDIWPGASWTSQEYGGKLFPSTLATYRDKKYFSNLLFT